MNKINRAVLAISLTLTLGVLSAGRILAETQVFLNDVKIDGKHVDRCIVSYRFPSACSEAATELAANKFCEKMGYRYASKWSWHNGRNAADVESVWKYTEEYRDGELWSGWKIAEGSWLFETIVCER